MSDIIAGTLTIQQMLPELSEQQIKYLYRELRDSMPKRERDYAQDYTDATSKAVLVAASAAYNEALDDVQAAHDKFFQVEGNAV